MSMTRHHHINTSSSSTGGGGGGNIDALLEDLQRSVSRPGSSLGGPLTNGYSNTNGNVITTGFREFAKSTRTEKNGQPAETNKEYHIEYLNPSNTTTVMSETKGIPNFESFKNVEHQKHTIPVEDNQLKSYKEVQKSYQYNTNTNKSQSHSVPRGTDVTLKQNINELDTLLNDLNQAHRTGYSIDTSLDHHRTNGFSEPLTSSTPRGHVSRIEKKTFEENRSQRVGDSPAGRSSEFKKELVFTGSRDPSPARQIRDEYYYESKSTSGRSARTNPLLRIESFILPPHQTPPPLPWVDATSAPPEEPNTTLVPRLFVNAAPPRPRVPGSTRKSPLTSPPTTPPPSVAPLPP
ncbi:hypothetical protein WDU94_012070 [Cyamophila willieti]